MQRLKEAICEIHQVREICQAPSISFGVVHKGKVILRESIGYRDVERKLEANPDTIYMIGSCSKMFTSAALGILVDEEKVQWLNLVSKHLPDFNPIGDSRIGQSADLIDVLRHSTGLTAPDSLCFGPRGSSPLDAKQLIPLLNLMPTSNNEGQRFNRHWMYNNATYGLAAEVIERVTCKPFPDFVRSRILQPLGLDRTVLTTSDVEEDDNLAYQYAILDNGAFSKLPTESWPLGHNPPQLAVTGIGSSLNDMLTWCISVLSAERGEVESSPTNEGPTLPSSPTSTNKKRNPLKQMTRVRRGYWTRPPDDPAISAEAAVGMGWIRMMLPSSMLGAFSGNGFTREPPLSMHLNNILGTQSEKRLMVGHTGGVMGGVTTVWTFPETQSAIVTMANTRQLGDASDFTAQVLIQALFDLQPRIDLLPWARKEVELKKGFYSEKLLRPWTENRQETDDERDRTLYAGEYQGFEGLFTLHIIANQDETQSTTRLSVMFNSQKRSMCDLVFYKSDHYSFFTGDLDYWLAEWFPWGDYRETILEFKWDDMTEKVSGIWWLWSKEEKPAWFKRVE
ncbi:beta-lactamase/transpeptidase-like protein [Aspergillus bertholletiae]|uniref:Beta-lactamase/transpeptidase-like protein n=1 Tax=Aspergillus bertholletiae TaxID=1226010 RepID=A0A5N7B6M6_9EURO|nr:beta-lactamase/transpeptidase-like protein [Aspergillus bertholletiae]